MKYVRSKKQVVELLDSILYSTKFSGRTKALYAYFTQGEQVIDRVRVCYVGDEDNRNLTFRERAGGDVALALYALNMKLNGAWHCAFAGKVRPATLAAWRTAIRLIDSARAQLRI